MSLGLASAYFMKGIQPTLESYAQELSQGFRPRQCGGSKNIIDLLWDIRNAAKPVFDQAIAVHNQINNTFNNWVDNQVLQMKQVWQEGHQAWQERDWEKLGKAAVSLGTGVVVSVGAFALATAVAASGVPVMATVGVAAVTAAVASGIIAGTNAWLYDDWENFGANWAGGVVDMGICQAMILRLCWAFLCQVAGASAANGER